MLPEKPALPADPEECPTRHPHVAKTQPFNEMALREEFRADLLK